MTLAKLVKLNLEKSYFYKLHILVIYIPRQLLFQGMFTATSSAACGYEEEQANIQPRTDVIKVGVRVPVCVSAHVCVCVCGNELQQAEEVEETEEAPTEKV